ncbi:MAG: sugar kinase [Candidatus Omnitrophica bacterium]|nr:sugar kinase [Candidatus Omnitrophota bacterium]
MIISRAPVRITLGGGGTDMAAYYSKYGGFTLSGSIAKYVYLAINKRFDDTIRLSYSKTEIVRTVESIKHRIFREAFKLLNVGWGIEAVSIADIPANCGLGSSSVFTVSLLNALHNYKREYVSLEQLAEEACDIEINRLGEPIGKQDQYMAAFGGLTALWYEKDGKVRVEPLNMHPDLVHQLERNLLLFYTRIERSASDILADQKENVDKQNTKTVDSMHQLKEIGLETKKAFEAGDLHYFGELLDHHWKIKKTLSAKISDPFIDECYEIALKNGAVGGKIMGAGGGGFFMFYCPRDRTSLIDAMQARGLMWMPFRFEFQGAKIVANLSY